MSSPMRRQKQFVFALLIAASLVAACSAAPAATPSSAGTGMPEITISTKPDPASSLAETELIIDVKDTNGQPLTGATVAILTDMMSHSMGLMQGQASEQGNGRYATLVPFSMGGDWKVTVEVRDSQRNLLRRQDFVLPVQ